MTVDAHPLRTVMCFGDSNTHGTCAMRDLDDVTRLPPGMRWPGVMATDLGDAWSVVEEGHPGRTTVHDDPVEGIHKNGLRILPALLETHCPLDLVIVMLGTNDLKARFGVPASDIASSVERLVAVIAGSVAGPRSAPPRILLVAPAPIEEVGALGDMFEGGAAKSRALARLYAEISRQADIRYFDAGSVAQVDPLDGIHLDMRSHERLGHALADTVRSMFDME